MSSGNRIYSVSGVTCEHCRSAITREVSTVAGVESVEVDLDRKVVIVDGAAASDAALRAAIDAAGYDIDETGEQIAA
jgi:copper chaperone